MPKPNIDRKTDGQPDRLDAERAAKQVKLVGAPGNQDDAMLGLRRELIINRPDLQTAAQRYGYLSFTVFARFFWLYLVVPLFSFIAWAAGLHLAYQVMIQELATSELVAILTFYGMGIAALAGIYMVWAVTSLLRWRNTERRQPTLAVDDLSLARSHFLSLTQLEVLRTTNRYVVSAEQLDQMFIPPGIESGDPG